MMAIQIPYNGDAFNFSVNHDNLIPEVQMDVFEYGETAVAIHDDYKEEYEEKGYWLAAMYKSGYRVDLF